MNPYFTRVKIADFNVSKKFVDRTLMTVTGVEEWQAPEMLRHESYSEKIDMWSAGCVLYFILVGDKPFKQANVA